MVLIRYKSKNVVHMFERVKSYGWIARAKRWRSTFLKKSALSESRHVNGKHYSLVR